MRMRLGLRRRRPRVTPEQVLGSRPVRNENLSVEETEGGGLRIAARGRGDWWVRRLNEVGRAAGRERG